MSGPITGKDGYEKMFYAAEEEIRETWPDAAVINPARISKSMGANWEYDDYMRADMALLEMCDTIIMLPGWEESPGARREYKTAKRRGMVEYDWTPDEKNGGDSKDKAEQPAGPVQQEVAASTAGKWGDSLRELADKALIRNMEPGQEPDPEHQISQRDIVTDFRGRRYVVLTIYSKTAEVIDEKGNTSVHVTQALKWTGERVETIVDVERFFADAWNSSKDSLTQEEVSVCLQKP